MPSVRRAGAFLVVMVMAFGAVACDPNPLPTAFDALCGRGSPDGRPDVKFTWDHGARDGSTAPLSARLVAMSRRCCPDWKSLAHASKRCAKFADFGYFTPGAPATVDLGRRATDDDREAVVRFLRRYGTAHAT